MRQKQQMDALQQPKIYGLPAYKSVELPNEDSTEEKRSWFFRRLVDIGVITMANSQPKPPGFYLNFSTLAVLVTIFASIFGGVLWVYNATYNSAYQKGLDDAEKKQILERLKTAEDDVKKAQQLQLLNNKSEEHPEKTPEKKK